MLARLAVVLFLAATLTGCATTPAGGPGADATLADAKLRADVVANLSKIQRDFHGSGAVEVADVAVNERPDATGVWAETWLVRQDDKTYEYPLIFVPADPRDPSKGTGYMTTTDKGGPPPTDATAASEELDDLVAKSLGLARKLQSLKHGTD